MEQRLHWSRIWIEERVLSSVVTVELRVSSSVVVFQKKTGKAHEIKFRMFTAEFFFSLSLLTNFSRDLIK